MQKSEFEQRIEASRTNNSELRAIAEELKFIDLPWGGPLRIKALSLALRLSPRARPMGRSGLAEAAKSEQPPDWAARFNLPRPDGRALHRYRVPSTTFSQLRDYLKQRSQLLITNPSRGDCALFVLWAAEWFRRCYAGGGQKWEDLGEALGMSTAWSGWRRLADTGLKQWRIPELRINGAHYRLAAIARQGGFPVAALEGGRTGWASRYLERLVGLVLVEPDPTLEVADRHALQLGGSIPDTWRNEEMRIVSAELVVEVVKLRRQAEAGGAIAGSLVSAWLDHHRPNWRDELPLVIEGDSGRALVDGLMRAKALKGGSGSIGATRLLVLNGDMREERVRLVLDGALESAAGRSELASLGNHWSRLRLYAAGGFAEHAPGELALVEPEDEGRWVSRRTIRSADFVLPFGLAVQAELRGEGQRLCGPFRLPGGDPIGDTMRVFVSLSTDEHRSEMAYLTSASGSFRAEELFVDLPEGWTIKPHTEGAICDSKHAAPGRRTIWSLRGGAGLVVSERGDQYLLRTGQTGDRRDTLDLVGDRPHLCAHAEVGVPLFLGWPRLELCDGGRPRSPGAGEAWWRLKGENFWRPYSADKPNGRVEIAWKDATSGHIRDRKDASILPAAFKIDRATAGNILRLQVNGWDGQLELDRGDRISPNEWRFARGSHQAQCKATLSAQQGSPIQLILPLPHRAHVANWRAAPVKPNSVISLAEIGHFVARTESRCELMADLFDRNRRPVAQGTMSWFIDGELPLSAIRDDLEALLRPLGELDARVRLNFNDGNEDYWFVSEFDILLERDARGLVPNQAIAADDVQIVGRALAKPNDERSFGSYGLASDQNHRPIQLPPLNGDWLIYLRQRDRVLSRPHFIRASPLSVAPPGPLARAMAFETRDERLVALEQLCRSIAEAPTSPATRATLRSIITLALSLNGLPPSTFDLLQFLVHRPELGPLLLFEAASDQVETLMRLADGLPFSWSMIPKRYWDEAAKAQFEILFAAMPNALALFAEAISGRRRQLAELDPILAPLLDLPTPNSSVQDAAQSFLNRSGDRVPEHGSNPFRPELEALLPEWKLSEHFYRALDAPHAAALAAQGKAQLNLGQIYAIKDMARQHPRYFGEAYAAALKENILA